MRSPFFRGKVAHSSGADAKLDQSIDLFYPQSSKGGTEILVSRGVALNMFNIKRKRTDLKNGMRGRFIYNFSML